MSNQDKQNIIAALEVWERLGDTPVNEDGDKLDEDFEFKTISGHTHNYEKGSSLDDLWHDLEEYFYPFSIGFAANDLYDENGNELKERTW